MFGQWLHVRIRAAEKALAQGRIDDVLAAVAQPDLREHARGQKLLDELVKPLLARARLHRQAGALREALADLDRLVALGRGSTEVLAVRQQYADERRRVAAASAEDQHAYRQTAEQLQAGHLDSVRANLERIDDSRRREHLAGELDVRVQRATQLLEQAAEALQRDEVMSAARLWQDACDRHGQSHETDRFAAELSAPIRKTIEHWHHDGNVDRLLAARTVVAALLARDPALADCDRLLELCARSAAQLAATDYAGLRHSLLRLKAAGRDAGWVKAALEALDHIAKGQEALLASPLGLVATRPGSAPAGPDAQPATAAFYPSASAATPPDPRALRLDRPLLVLVDGGGSSLLLQTDRVRIGRASSSAPVDVRLPADLEAHHADILRRGEDYYLTAFGPAAVNHRPVQQARLRDGDRIVLGEQAKFTFHKPSAKSESAVLRLSHRCRLPQDVSDVILFRDTCLIGAGESCHVRTREDHVSVVLFERGGALHARQMDSGFAGPTQRARAVLAAQPMEFGGQRITVKLYDAADPQKEPRA